MVPRLCIWLLLLVLVVMAPLRAIGRTWLVERDETGDFVVIQDAVDAAASGDTIRIGPGRFNEQRLVTCPGWSDSVRVLIPHQELTLIGSGEATIIGSPDPWDSNQDENKGIVASDYWGNNFLRIQGIRFENMRDGIYSGYETVPNCSLVVQDCQFIGNFAALILFGTGDVVEISDCQFFPMSENGRHVLSWYQNSLTIERSEFHADGTVYGQTALSLNWVGATSISSCEFAGGISAISSSYGGPISLANCSFSSHSVSATYFSTNVSATIDSCTFRNVNRAISSPTWNNSISMRNSVVESVVDCGFLVADTGGMSIQNCDLSKGERGVIWVLDTVPCQNTGIIDMTNNFWGTDNPDSIQTWIRDSSDSADACYSVDFEPFSPIPTPTQTKSLGGFKALFR